MIDIYPTYAVVTYRLSDEYELPWGRARTDMYGGCSDGYPWFAYDGLEDAWPVDTYEDKYLVRQAVPAEMTIGLTTGSAATSDTHDIRAEVCMEPGGVSTAVRVYMVQVLDNYPDVPEYARNCFMQAAETEDILVHPGDCVEVERTFTFDAVNMSRKDDIKIIAWAQVPADLWPAEVFQTAQMGWPFQMREGIFADGFETGDMTLWSASNP